MKAGETYVVDDGRALYLGTGNAGGIELVTSGSDIITIGSAGEIVRDLPLVKTGCVNCSSAIVTFYSIRES